MDLGGHGVDLGDIPFLESLAEASRIESTSSSDRQRPKGTFDGKREVTKPDDPIRPEPFALPGLVRLLPHQVLCAEFVLELQSNVALKNLLAEEICEWIHRPRPPVPVSQLPVRPILDPPDEEIGNWRDASATRDTDYRCFEE